MFEIISRDGLCVVLIGAGLGVSMPTVGVLGLVVGDTMASFVGITSPFCL